MYMCPFWKKVRKSQRIIPKLSSHHQHHENDSGTHTRHGTLHTLYVKQYPGRVLIMDVHTWRENKNWNICAYAKYGVERWMVHFFHTTLHLLWLVIIFFFRRRKEKMNGPQMNINNMEIWWWDNNNGSTF